MCPDPALSSAIGGTFSCKICSHGLPWWRSGWESACQCREHEFEPWSGKIPHATEQLGPWATATEPARLEPVLRNGRGRDSERPAHRDEEWPPLAPTRESPCTETKTQHSQKERKKERSFHLKKKKLRPLLLRSTDSRRAGSVVVAHGPSCSAACGILPDQGSNPCPLHWQVDSQPLHHQGSPRLIFYVYKPV